MEYASLSKRTGVKEYGEKALKAYDALDRQTKPDGGLYPVYLDPNSGSFRTSIHLAYNPDTRINILFRPNYPWRLGRFLLWIFVEDVDSHRQEKWAISAIFEGLSNSFCDIARYRRMYEESSRAVITHLIKKSTPSGLTYIAEKENGNIVDKMDHLVCFAGAMFALGAYPSELIFYILQSPMHFNLRRYHNITDNVEEHMNIGKEITRTCHEFYKRQASGLSPELVRFSPGNDFVSGASHYILRPGIHLPFLTANTF